MKLKAATGKRPYHHGDLRAALMQAALQLIQQHGVKGLALSDAARLSGVSVAAPYRHFKDRETLLADIAEEGFVMFRDALAQVAKRHAQDRVKQLVEMGMAYVNFAQKHSSHFKVMWEGGISKDKYPVVGAIAYQSFQLLEQAATSLLPAAPKSRQQALVCAAWSVAHGYASLRLDGELDVLTLNHEGDKLLRQSMHLLVDQFAGVQVT